MKGRGERREGGEYEREREKEERRGQRGRKAADVAAAVFHGDPKQPHVAPACLT